MRACHAAQISTASYYRHIRSQSADPRSSNRPSTGAPGRPALTEEEREYILETLYSKEFIDLPPRQVYATLLDEGAYLCSWRTMYRLLKERQASGERRRIRRHPTYQKPELIARAPNQVWSWDITYLKTPVRGRFYYLYVVIDIYSRYVVGWLLADRECQELAKHLLSETIRKFHVVPGVLTVHADRGAPMKSQSVSDLLTELGVDRSHSRPRVSNDNAYSEAAFRTLKYSPEFPDRFADYAEAEAFCQRYFDWYNNEHYHTSIALLTPAQVHYGEATQILARRQATLDAAFALNPKRFGDRRPSAGQLPEQVGINAPSIAVMDTGSSQAA